MHGPAQDSSLIGRILHLLLITTAACAASYARTAVGPLQDTIKVALALDDNKMALLQGPVLTFPMLILSIPLGLAIDRYSRVQLLRIFTLCSLAGTVLTAVASSFSLMLIARGIVGLTLATNPIILSLIADVYSPSQRGRSVMIMSIGQLGGLAGAFVFGGNLLARYGTGTTGWHSAMLWLAAPLVPVVVLLLLIREPPRRSGAIEHVPISEIWRNIWCKRAATAPLLAGLVIMELTITATVFWATPAFSRRFVVTPDRLGTIMAVAIVVSGCIGPIVGGTLADICQRSGGPRRTLLVMLTLTLVDMSAAEFPTLAGVRAATIGLVVFITITTAVLVMGTTAFTVVIPERTRGLFTSLLNGGGIIAAGLAPVVVSELASAMTGQAPIAQSLAAVSMGTCFLSAIAFFFGARQFRRSSEQQTLAKNGAVSG